ncbi:hypothetical protein SASPL_147815 [Salvia splendens]|uniref:POTRA domain-containing protein n=1 Tax=Salvia splendens TaxID=180675 RepID=A0A8X8WGI7_SALSN|nr:SAM50-like protein gop-3 [Salvia splendens]KAG6393571.1 hypothetical protein SASPL_147815 [Salvia splendens]
MEPHPGSDPKTPNPDYEEIEDDEADEDDSELEEDDDGDDKSMSPDARMQRDRADMDSLFRRLSSERVPVRVHDIVVKGNKKTKDSVIEAEVEHLFRDANTFQQLLRAAGVAKLQLQRLGIFDSVSITLDAGPPELPGTANVVIDVSEGSLLSGDFGVYSKPEARSWSLEAAARLKNLLGYGDLWDGSLAYGWGQSLEVSSGVALPRFKSIPTPISGRISLLSQDWLKFSSYKERALGLSLSLLSTGNHDLSYNLSWRTLTDPSQMSSYTVRRQLGHNLVSALKYAFKIDYRDSPMRPTRGHAFVSTTQIGGLFPDLRSLRFFRQEFDLRYAIPLGFYRAALNFGISGGVLLPWGGRGSLSSPTYLPERFFMGGNTSPVCSLIGPTSILGFKSRGLGLAEPRRVTRDNPNDGSPDDSGIDNVGGDLALTAFADISFDLPLSVLRNAGIHGHVFACTGSLNKLSENSYKEFSVQKFKDSFRSSVGAGLVVPTQLFRMEVNYCYILKKQEHDKGKTGVQFCFSSPN